MSENLVRIECDCGATGRVPAKSEPRHIRCKQCGARIHVPATRSQKASDSFSQFVDQETQSRRRTKASEPQGLDPKTVSRIARGVAALLLIFAAAYIVYGFVAASGENGSHEPGAITPEHVQHLFVSIAILLLVMAPSFYTLKHGVQFGRKAAAARRKGLVALGWGLGMTVLGGIAAVVVFLLAMPLGVTAIGYGMLLPLAPAVAGLANFVTGVDIVATLTPDDEQ